jgi:hypothetical protein
MPREAPSPDNKERSRRSLEKAREIAAAREDAAAENLKRQALGRLLQRRNDHNAARSNPLIFN